jgi:hypothetical protein
MDQPTRDVPVRCVRIAAIDDIAAVLDGAGLQRERPVVVLVGGAGGMGEQDLQTVAAVLRDAVVPVVVRHDAVVIDGGTDSGVMQLIGRARATSGGRFPLVGVAAVGTVVVPGHEANSEAAELEPNHTLVLLVPGTQWGDEAPWIAEVAGVVAGGRPAVTVLVNGGQIAYTDVAESLADGRSVVVLAGSGRTADAIAAAGVSGGGDPRAVAIAVSPLTSIIDVGRVGAVATAIEAALDG